MHHCIVSLLSLAALLPVYKVTATSFRQCNPPEFKADTGNLVCAERGLPQQYASRNFHFERRIFAASADDCNLQCYADYRCRLAAWNSQNSGCTFYSGTITKRQFLKDEDSPFIATDWRCIEPLTGCEGLWNPSFDTPNIHGNNLPVIPTNFSPPHQQVYLQPWSTFQEVPVNNSAYGLARLGSASDLPKNHEPIPEGNGKNFGIILSRSDAPQYLVQIMELEVDTVYNYELTYSILSYEKAPIANDNTYDLVFATPWTKNRNTVLEDVTFDQTGVDGAWHTVSGSFQTVPTIPPRFYERGNYTFIGNVFIVAVLPYYINGSYVPGSGGSSSVAIDNLKITKAPAGKALSLTSPKPLTKKFMTSFPLGN